MVYCENSKFQKANLSQQYMALLAPTCIWWQTSGCCVRLWVFSTFYCTCCGLSPFLVYLVT